MNERVLLSFLIAVNKDKEPPVEPIVPFPAFYMEDPRICTAVLERTAILASTEDKYEKITARHDQVHVDPEMLEWRTKTADYEGRSFHPGEGMKHHRQPSKSPWHQHPHDVVVESARQKTDDRAIQNRQEVEETKEKELRLLRRQASERPATQEKEPEVIQSTVPTTASIEVIDVPQHRHSVRSDTKICRRCGNSKPRGEFAATGIYGGYCATCAPLEKAERAAARDQAVGIAHGGRPAKDLKSAPKRKYNRRPKPDADKPADKIAAVVAANGYDHVVKLLHRRDSLKLELAKVNEKLQEALA